MKEEELNRFIELLENSNSKEDAYLAIYQYGGGPDESFAKANKQGLELFAAQLLKASVESNNIENNERGNIIPLDFEEDWINGDIFMQYIELTDKRGDSVIKGQNEPTLIDKLVPIGCVAGLIFFLVSAGIGAFSILKWLL